MLKYRFGFVSDGSHRAGNGGLDEFRRLYNRSNWVDAHDLAKLH